MRRYTVVQIPDVEKGGYTVQVPALPGCVTEGDTYEEAIENARDAVRLYIEDVIACGEAVPDETVPPRLTAVDV